VERTISKRVFGYLTMGSLLPYFLILSALSYWFGLIPFCIKLMIYFSISFKDSFQTLVASKFLESFVALLAVYVVRIKQITSVILINTSTILHQQSQETLTDWECLCPRECL